MMGLFSGDTSCIIDGSGLSGGSDSNKVVKEIHEENLKRLSEMSLEEILLEQQQLIHALSN